MAFILSLLFGFLYTFICVGCCMGGLQQLVKGENATEKVVGAFVLAVGILGFVVLF